MDIGAITVLILDVDGVLTPGDVTFDETLSRSMSFNIHDGCAIGVWRRVGHRLAILSGRRSPIVQERAAELGIDKIRQGVVDKGRELGTLLNEMGATEDSTCYIGDDLTDIEPIRRCGFGVAVADAVPTVKRWAQYVTRRDGGAGAVAEVIELILRKQQRWTSSIVGT